MKCREESGQIVMTIFYEVDPSSVRKQKGDFGSAFMKTCQGKTKQVKQRWSKALTDVANIEGEHSLNWANEAEMIQKIATDVSNKLNVTPSRDFDGMVGLEAHLRNLNPLLCLESDDVKMIGMWGPAGIGKTTIARALYNQLSSSFRFICFMGNLKGSYRSLLGVDNYDSKLDLQSQLLSRILDRGDMRVRHLGAVKEWLHDQRVLIILDDVDDLEKLEVLAKEPSWFGPGSRIIVTTEDINILKAHGINDIYNVDFPSEKEAIEILCLSAFKGTSVQDGFEELANRVAGFCSNLPLGLAVVGKSLRGQNKNEWERQLIKFETSLKGTIEDALRVGYDGLTKKDQALFLHIACFFFFHEDVDHLTTMLADSNLDVGNGLKTLNDKSLVHISFYREVVMHSLLQKLGRQIVVEQSDEPGKRQFLVDPKDIRDVLADGTGTTSLIGIKFDMTNTGDLCISGRAFEGMRNLQFLQIYTQLGMENGNVSSLHIREELVYLPRLRLLSWNSFPGKRLPPEFQPERLVELDMQFSNLEKLWDGIHPLGNLKKINLNYSHRLKEIPNLSNATNLETLSLAYCSSLVELPYSIKNLHKLKRLKMRSCEELRVIPPNINLASLKEVDMSYCSELGIFPDISSNIRTLSARDTSIKDIPASVVGRWSRCRVLKIGSKSLERLTHVPVSVTSLDLTNSDIKAIPDCIIGLSHLVDLIIENCTKLVSISALPPSLKSLNANSCVSLKTVRCSFHSPINVLTFYNCLKLDEETGRGIIQQSVYEYICLPAKEVPAEFTHKATGKSIIIPLAPGGEGTSSPPLKFKACFLLSAVEDCRYISINCRLNSKEGVQINRFYSSARLSDLSPLSEHLFIFSGDLFSQRSRYHEVEVATNEITFEFSCEDHDDKIIECGVQIWTEEAEGNSSNSEVDYLNTERSSSYREVDYLNTERSSSEVENFEIESNSSYLSDDLVAMILSLPDILQTSEHTSRWSWREKLGLKKKKKKMKTADKTWLMANLILAVFDSAKGESSGSEVGYFGTGGGSDDYTQITECGVEMLAEEGENSSSSKWQVHTDGAVQDCKMLAEEGESVVKSSNHTGWWNWHRKLGLKKKKKTER